MLLNYIFLSNIFFTFKLSKSFTHIMCQVTVLCHALKIYIYLIESPPAIKKISLFQFFYSLILILEVLGVRSLRGQVLQYHFSSFPSIFLDGFAKVMSKKNRYLSLLLSQAEMPLGSGFTTSHFYQIPYSN